MSDAKSTPGFTPGPWFAERIRLDGNEWSICSTARNLPPFTWLPRLHAYLPPLQGYGGGARLGRGESEQQTEAGVLAARENAANARLIAASPIGYELANEILRACNRSTGREISDVTRLEIEPLRKLAERFMAIAEDW